ncbi:hypothetical protein [Roseovarius confluentis]|uniref:hypothetical protein n=1 Tax=Roseovarius confluentis TaxID=1852027 RepID=UPI003BADAFBC
MSLATENNIVGTEDGLIVEGFLDPDTEGFQAPLGTRARAEEVGAAIGDFPLYQGGLVGRRGTATLIIAEILDDDLATAAYDAVMALVAAEPFPRATGGMWPGKAPWRGICRPISTMMPAGSTRWRGSSSPSCC